MGIDCLLSVLKPVLSSTNISTFANQRAAIDVMGWLYRGAFQCALELITKKPTTAYLSFTYHMINVFKRWSITPIFCIDGRELLAKEKTMKFRIDRKQKDKEKGLTLLNEGKTEEAKKVLSRSLNVTKKMIYRLVDMLTSLNIEFIIAPYEGDAQAAYLCQSGYADFAISEDSDLLCYNCPITVFKLSGFGDCQYVNMKALREKRNRKEKLGDENMDILFSLSEVNFTYACILAGCDYLPSVKGMGMKKALNLFDRFRTLESVIGRMRVEKNFMGKVPDGYENAVKKVANLFRYQLVYDPVTKTMVTLNKRELPGPFVEENKGFVGYWIENIEEYAKGKIDLETLKEREPEVLNVKEMFAPSRRKKMEESHTFQSAKLLTEAITSETSKQVSFSQTVIKLQRKPSINSLETETVQQQIDISETVVSLENKIEIRELEEEEQVVYDEHEHADQKGVNKPVQEEADDKRNLLFDICKEFSTSFSQIESKESQKEIIDKIEPILEPDSLSKSLNSGLSFLKDKTLSTEMQGSGIETPNQLECSKETTTLAKNLVQEGGMNHFKELVSKQSHKRKFSDMSTQPSQGGPSPLKTHQGGMKDLDKKANERELKKAKKSPSVKEDRTQPKISLFFSKPKPPSNLE